METRDESQIAAAKKLAKAEKREKWDHANQMRLARVRCLEAALRLFEFTGESDVSAEMILSEADKFWDWCTHWHRPDETEKRGG